MENSYSFPVEIIELVNIKHKSFLKSFCTICNLNRPSKEWYRLNRDVLETSAVSGCAGCTMIVSSLNHIWPNAITPYTLLYVDGTSLRICPDGSLPTVQLFSLPDTTWPWASSKFVPNSPKSTHDLVTQAIEWVQHCDESHRCALGDIPQLPLRVLDVGVREQASDRLHLFKTKGIRAQYVCLSHLWASHANFITTKLNYQNHLESISFYDLPKIYREAIFFTRQLNIQYLWIDSLCILQDDAADWQQQAAVMGQIYHNVYLTIAADVFQEDSDMNMSHAADALFWRLPVHFKSRALRFAYPFEAGKLSTIGARMTRRHFWSHLVKRGWIFQEELMSRRYMRFRNCGIALQCCDTSCSCCSLDDTGSCPGRSSHLESNDTTLLMLRGALTESFSQYQRTVAWHSNVEKFSRLDLTYEQYYFPALASIARKISKHIFLGSLEPHYVAGLWLHSFAQDILRHSNIIFGYNAPRPADWRAPSWSWASQRNFVAFPEQEAIVVEDTVFRSHFDVLNITCTPVGVDSMGQLKSAHALLSCCIFPAELSYHVDETAVVPVRTPKGEIWISVGKERTNISTYFKYFEIHPDYAIYIQGPHHIPSQSAVLLMSTASQGPVHLESEETTQFVLHSFLVLRMLENVINNDMRCYERIGLVEGYRQYYSHSDLDSGPLCGTIVPKSISLH